MQHALCLILIACSGCFWATTKSEGDAIRKDVAQLQEQVGTKLDAQITQLKSVLEDATRLLKRNSADLGADLDSLRNDVHAANGLAVAVQTTATELKAEIESYRKSTEARITVLEQRLAQLEAGKPGAATAASADELWKSGSAAFQAGRYHDAIEIYKRLHQSFPTHERADDAMYFKGQSYTNLKDWERALSAYQQLADKFPTGTLTDDGYYFAALAAQQLKLCAEARAYLLLLKSKHPKSDVLKQANELDAKLKKDQKNKNKCTD